MEYVQHLLTGKIDFRGQRLANRLQQESLVAAAAIAFVVGWLLHSLTIALSIYGGIFALVLLLCVPPWPLYNKHDVLWLSNLSDSVPDSKDS